MLTIVESPDASTIDAAAMNAGCQLAGWYVAEALRLSGMHRQPLSLRNAIKLHEWLVAKERAEISLREIMRLGPSQVRSKDAAEAAVRLLQEHGHLVVKKTKPLLLSVIKERGL